MRTYRALWIIELSTSNPSDGPPAPFSPPPLCVEFSPLEFVTAGLIAAVLPGAAEVTSSAADTNSQQIGTRAAERSL